MGINTNPNETWIIKSSSSLLVHGSTNINTFTCTVASYGKTDTLSFIPPSGKQNIYRVHSVLHVPVKILIARTGL
ncbi:MAG: hypothetical protein IPK25_05640 [Saprospiraceae bacterium]|nr:hypothetical protein [Saprospiraceae bacterium]